MSALKLRRCAAKLGWIARRDGMKLTLSMLALAIIAAASLAVPAHAVPPVAQSSPGYEARLQESRKAATTTVTPAPQPKKKRKGPPQ
jgi:hypothetical protein